MENYAAFMAHTDHHVGRLLTSLEASGELDNTLVFYVVGDNGASPEGGLEGTFSELAALLGIDLGLQSTINRLDEIGGPTSEPHVPVGWAWAMNAPFQWTKQVASHFGGTRNPLIVHWPRGIKAKGEQRTQFHHVIDIVPTILEACHIAEPTVVNGIPQKPIEGVSMCYSFDDATAADQRTTQYFEMKCNRGIYHDGWMACSRLGTPIDRGTAGLDFRTAPWELYNIEADFSQADDLAAKHPEKLKALQAKFVEEATKYNVFPLDPRFSERMDPKLRVSGTPPTKWNYFGNNVWLPEPIGPQLFPRAHSITAEVTIPETRRGRSRRVRRRVLGRLVALRERGQAELPLHVLRSGRCEYPRHDRSPCGEGDAQDRVHPHRLEGRRRHAPLVRQWPARGRRRTQAIRFPPRPRTV